MVTPLYEREDGNAPGPFYVVKDQCITCSLPTNTAPVNIQYHKRPCEDRSASLISHCVVVRQPETAEELDRMIEVVRGSCVAAYRYCGTDQKILERLVKAGCKEQCDALVQKKTGSTNLTRLQRRKFLAEMLMLGCAILAFGWIGAALVLVCGDAELRQRLFRTFWYLWVCLAIIPSCGFCACWVWRSSLKRKITNGKLE